jgi:hypothetical protein
MVQAFRLVLSSGFGCGCCRMSARNYILPYGFYCRGQTLALGKRYALWRIPVFYLHVSFTGLAWKQVE